MDFTGTDGSDDARGRAHALARRIAEPSAPERDRRASWNAEIFRQMGAAGLLAAVLPREYGGGGLTALDWSAQQEGFGAGSEDAGLALAWAEHTLRCAVPLWQLGSDAQRQRYLPSLCRGEQVGAFADGTADTVNLPSTVGARSHRHDAPWRLHGRVPMVVNAPVAAVFIVTAVTDPDRGPNGVSAFLVEATTPGLSVGAPVVSLGLRTALRADVVLEGCEVPSTNILGDPGAGLTGVLRLARLWERAAALAPWIGLMQTLFERAVAHAKDGMQLGQPLSSFQSVRARLADMKIRLELSRRMQARASWQMSAPDRVSERDAAEASLFISESAGWIAREAFQLAGASGRRADPFLERAYRDAALLGEHDPGYAVLRSVIAGSLLELG
jgi:alkylation response protein AidB-like acyl-CoA dehydrogenase